MIRWIDADGEEYDDGILFDDELVDFPIDWDALEALEAFDELEPLAAARLLADEDVETPLGEALDGGADFGD